MNKQCPLKSGAHSLDVRSCTLALSKQQPATQGGAITICPQPDPGSVLQWDVARHLWSGEFFTTTLPLPPNPFSVRSAPIHLPSCGTSENTIGGPWYRTPKGPILAKEAEIHACQSYLNTNKRVSNGPSRMKDKLAEKSLHWLGKNTASHVIFWLALASDWPCNES